METRQDLGIEGQHDMVVLCACFILFVSIKDRTVVGASDKIERMHIT